MQRLTIELTGNKALRALKDLEHEQLIRIVREPDLNSYTFPGKPISNEDFRRWIEFAEESPTVTLVEAKQRWTEQKKKLQKLKNCLS
jgi:hypothetical protein